MHGSGSATGQKIIRWTGCVSRVQGLALDALLAHPSSASGRGNRKQPRSCRAGYMKPQRMLDIKLGYLGYLGADWINKMIS